VSPNRPASQSFGVAIPGEHHCPIGQVSHEAELVPPELGLNLPAGHTPEVLLVLPSSQ